MKRWILIFKILSNINRLKIIKLLANGKSLDVGNIADQIDISLNATSKHLIALNNLDILESEGRRGHVYYRFNRHLPADIKKSINLFLQ